MDITFQLLLYIMKVKSQEDQLFCSLNFSDVMWKPPIGAVTQRSLYRDLFNQNCIDFDTEIAFCKTPFVDEKVLILQ